MKEKSTRFNGISIPYSASLDELEQMLKSSPPYCWVALIALGHKDSPESLQILKQLLFSQDPNFRRASLEAIGNHSFGLELENEIINSFKDSTQFVVRQACKTAASLKLNSAHDCIFEQLNSKSGSTRQTAISAISELWQLKDFEKLISIFKKDPNDKVCKEAAWVLYRRANSENSKFLFDLWHSDSVPRHRGWACHLASKFQLSGVNEYLKTLSVDQDGHVRKAAQNALYE